MIASFQTLFPLLAKNGIYVIEDLHTAYFPKYGGGEKPNHPGTSIEMLKALIDGLNYQYIEGLTANYTDQTIIEMCFYPKMAFLFKGVNGKDPRACVGSEA